MSKTTTLKFVRPPPTSPTEDGTIIEAVSEMQQMDYDELVRFLPHFSKTEQENFKDSIDFNELEYKMELRHRTTAELCMTIFQDEYISVMIAEYSRNLFDGKWQTTKQVILYEMPNNDLVGFFQGYLLLG